MIDYTPVYEYVNSDGDRGLLVINYLLKFIKGGDIFTIKDNKE